MFPKPLFLEDCAAVSVDDVYKRIQFKKRLHIVGWQHFDIPHNGSRPHADLKGDADHLL